MTSTTLYDELAGGEQHGDELLEEGKQRAGIDTLGGDEHGPDTLGGREDGPELLSGGEQHGRETLAIP